MLLQRVSLNMGGILAHETVWDDWHIRSHGLVCCWVKQPCACTHAHKQETWGHVTNTSPPQCSNVISCIWTCPNFVLTILKEQVHELWSTPLKDMQLPVDNKVWASLRQAIGKWEALLCGWCTYQPNSGWTIPHCRQLPPLPCLCMSRVAVVSHFYSVRLGSVYSMMNERVW